MINYNSKYVIWNTGIIDNNGKKYYYMNNKTTTALKYKSVERLKER